MLPLDQVFLSWSTVNYIIANWKFLGTTATQSPSCRADIVKERDRRAPRLIVCKKPPVVSWVSNRRAPHVFWQWHQHSFVQRASRNGSQWPRSSCWCNMLVAWYFSPDAEYIWDNLDLSFFFSLQTSVKVTLCDFCTWWCFLLSPSSYFLLIR